MCSPKSMLTILLAVVAGLVLGYAYLPPIREAVVALAPFALLAVCPLSMIGMMLFMNKDHKGEGSCRDDSDKDTPVAK